MKTRVIIYLIGILLLSSCRNCTKNSNNLYDRGVSQELAMQRKENIKNPVYELLFRIPESKDSMVCGDINIDFHISLQIHKKPRNLSGSSLGYNGSLYSSACGNCVRIQYTEQR